MRFLLRFLRSAWPSGCPSGSVSRSALGVLRTWLRAACPTPIESSSDFGKSPGLSPEVLGFPQGRRDFQQGCPQVGTRSGEPDPALSEEGTQHGGLVGHEPVNTELEQPLHFIALIDRPHVDGEVATVGVAHEPFGYQGAALVPGRHLEAGLSERGARHPDGRCQESGGLAGPHRRAEPGPEHLSTTRLAGIAERADADTIEGAALLDDPDERLDRGVGLRIDVDTQVGPGAEQLSQQRNRLAAVDSSSSDLGVVEVRNGAGAVGDTVELGVVEGQQHAVGRRVDIGLNVAVAQVDRVRESGQGVLGGLAGAAAMGERDWPIMIEVGPGSGSLLPPHHPVRLGASGEAMVSAAPGRPEANRPPAPRRYRDVVDVTDRLLHIVAQPAFALDEAALLIAAHTYEDLDVDLELVRLDDLAAAVNDPTLDGLTRHLFRDLGFGGATDDYYDPRNSYLNDVIARRIGIPITLSVVVIEVGRRLGVPLSGVGMPGHFLVRDRVLPDVFVDPFHGGARLDASGCRNVFHAIAGPQAQFSDAFLEPTASLDIVVRILNNLGAIASRRRDTATLEWVLRLRHHMLPVAEPAAALEFAELLASRGQFGEAADVFDELAASQPSDDDDRFRQRAGALRARLN